MRDKLGGSGVGIVLSGFHADHLATLLVPDVDKGVADLSLEGVDADDIVDKWKALPRVPATLGTKHRMCADNIRRGGKHPDEKVVGVHLDGKHVCDKHSGKARRREETRPVVEKQVWDGVSTCKCVRRIQGGCERKIWKTYRWTGNLERTVWRDMMLVQKMTTFGF